MIDYIVEVNKISIVEKNTYYPTNVKNSYSVSFRYDIKTHNAKNLNDINASYKLIYEYLIKFSDSEFLRKLDIIQEFAQSSGICRLTVSNYKILNRYNYKAMESHNLKIKELGNIPYPYDTEKLSFLASELINWSIKSIILIRKSNKVKFVNYPIKTFSWNGLMVSIIPRVNGIYSIDINFPGLLRYSKIVRHDDEPNSDTKESNPYSPYYWWVKYLYITNGFEPLINKMTNYCEYETLKDGQDIFSNN